MREEWYADRRQSSTGREHARAGWARGPAAATTAHPPLSTRGLGAQVAERGRQARTAATGTKLPVLQPYTSSQQGHVLRRKATQCHDVMPHGERRVTCGSAKKTRCGSSVYIAVSSCQRKSAKPRWDAHTVLQTSQLSGTVKHAATQDAMRTWLRPMAEAIGCCVYLESRAPSKKVNSTLYRESSARIDYMCVAPSRKGFQFCHGSCGSTSSLLWVRSDRLTKRACNG